MNLLDFKKMKKVATDGKTTTFEHEKGHRMVIMHAVLPRIQQEQIKRLPLYSGGKVKRLADGTPDAPLEVEKVPDEDAGQPTNNAPGSHDTHITINAAPASPMAPPSPSPAAQAPLQVEKSPAAPNLMRPDQTINAPAAAGLQQEAIQEQVPISEAMTQKQAEAEQERVATEKDIMARNQQNIQELKGHTDEFANYIRSNPINPKAYQESQDSEQKAQTAVGLFLGGLGGGGTSNVALDFLNKQIDRNIDAQKKNSENRNTIWGAYEHLYGDEKIANDMARVSANDILVHQVQMQAAKLGGAQAQQKAKELAAQKAIENNQLLIDSAGRLGTLQVGSGGGSSESTEGGLLKPGASITQLQYNPAIKDQKGAEAQFTAAQQTDKAIGALDSIFSKMHKSTNFAQHERQTLGPSTEHIPLIGGLVKGATDTTGTRDYEEAQAKLEKMVRAAIPGIGEDAVRKIVDSHSPRLGDSDERVKELQEDFVDWLRRNSATSLIEPAGVLNKR